MNENSVGGGEEEEKTGGGEAEKMGEQEMEDQKGEPCCAILCWVLWPRLALGEARKGLVQNEQGAPLRVWRA